VIRAAARHSDRITFAVGADPERLRWAIAEAKTARAAAGLDPESQPFGAYLSVVVHEDPEMARRLGEGGVSLFTRFSAMHGTVVGPAEPEQRKVFQDVHDAYDMMKHSRAGSAQAAVIPQAFAERFAVLGPAEYCVVRLRELIALGLDRLVIVGPSMGANAEEAVKAERAFAELVMPALRGEG
jgi:5,10-methylenetetrahydromethanopterin reductase